jgi:hypothetical protein
LAGEGSALPPCDNIGDAGTEFVDEDDEADGIEVNEGWLGTTTDMDGK